MATEILELKTYSTDEASDLLGVSRWTVHRLIQTGQLKVVAGFGNQRISHGELSRFVNNHEPYRHGRRVKRATTINAEVVR